jgi:hypothetical protein
MQSRFIKIDRGVFQGDSVSPLHLCLALFPVAHELNRSKCGYQVNGTEVKCHLLHMDDLKLIGRSEKKLRNEIRIVKKTIASDIEIEFGLETCG